jgi:hypothetical protein
MRCLRCGSEIPAQSRFCLSCGQPVAAPGPATIGPTGHFPAAQPAMVGPAFLDRPRRPIWPLIFCVALLLIAVAIVATFMVRRSLAAAGHARGTDGNLVVVNPNRGQPGELQAARPPAPLTSKPFTPAPNPQAQPPTPAPPPAVNQMPGEVLAYLSWLAQEDITRKSAEDKGEALLPELIPLLMTGGMGMDADTNEQNPLDKHLQSFRYWNQQLAALHQHHRTLEGLGYFWNYYHARGQPHVPEQCSLLHSLYLQHLGVQREAVTEISAGIATKDINRVSKQLQATKVAQDLLRRSDEQVGRVCAAYNVPQWFHVTVTAGETQLPPVLPR